MAHIVTSNIMNHADQNRILNPLQHGFRKGLSCDTQLVEIIDDVYKNLDLGQQIIQLWILAKFSSKCPTAY